MVGVGNLETIKNLTKSCAQNHSKNLIQNADDKVLKKKLTLNLQEIVKVLKLYGNKIEDIKLIEERVLKLNNVLTELSMCPVLVSSIFSEKDFLNSSNNDNFVTPAYDVLMIIFLNSDQHFRQRYFHEIIDEYYGELLENSRGISNVFDKKEFKAHVTFLLPFVKLEVLIYYGKNEKFESIAKQLAEDFYLHLKYPRFSKEDVFKVVCNKIGSSDYELISFDLHPLNEQKGHLGHYFYLDISVKFQQNTDKYRLFLKYINQENNLLQTLIYGASLNEAFFYEELLKEFEKLGLQDLLTFAPKCYLSKPSDLLVLDDMNSLGFKNLDHDEMLPYEGIKMISLQLARYHACSFILEDSLTKLRGRRVELDELYGKYFQELIFLINGPSRKSFESFWDSVDYLIDLFEEEIQYKISVSDFKEIAKTKVKDTFYQKLLLKSTKFRNCICHGDLYASNTVLKDQNGAYSNACLLDFQTMRYLPPAHDILLLIYINTTKETRDNFMDQILRDYYKELSRCLKNHSTDVSEVYTKEQFLESVLYMKSQALNQAFMYSHVLKAPAEIKKDLFGGKNHVYYLIANRTKLVQRSMISQLFRAAQKDYIQDMYELCVNK